MYKDIIFFLNRYHNSIIFFAGRRIFPYFFFAGFPESGCGTADKCDIYNIRSAIYDAENNRDFPADAAAPAMRRREMRHGKTKTAGSLHGVPGILLNGDD